MVLGVGMAAQASISAVQLGLPAIAPALRERYDLSLAQVGLLLAAATAGVIVSLIAWGVLADRLGERWVIAAGLSGAAVALWGASRADSIGPLALALVAAGLLGASANAASGRAVVGWFAAERRGFALGMRHMATPLGGAVAAGLLPLAVARGGVELAFLALGAACAAGALAAALGLRDAPVPAPAPGRAPAPASGPATPRGPLRDRAIWRLSLGTAMVVLAQIAVLSFLALYLHEERGWSVVAAALALAGVQAGGAVARVVAGAWSDRAGRRVRPLGRLALAAAVSLAVATASLPAPDALAVPALVVAGVLAMAGNGVSFAATAELADAGRAGTALGFQNTVLFVAVAIAPPAFGAAVGALSWPAAFALASACPLVGWWLLRPLAAREGELPHTRVPGAAATTPVGTGG